MYSSRSVWASACVTADALDPEAMYSGMTTQRLKNSANLP